MKTDPRVDQYIAKAPAFAQPILSEVRRRVGQTCPSAEESIKWNVPFFLLEGQLLASMAAFKKHTKIGIWTGKRPEMVDVADIAELAPAKEYAAKLKAAMVQAALAGAGKKKASVKKTPVSQDRAKEPVKRAPTAKKTPVKKSATKKSSTKKKR